MMTGSPPPPATTPSAVANASGPVAAAENNSNNNGTTTTTATSISTAATPKVPSSSSVVHNNPTIMMTVVAEPLLLPPNRFELELEFVQSLASPAYWHFLATSKTEEGDRLLLQDPAFLSFLKYLYATWSQPAYSAYLSYPHALYFLELVLEQPSVLAKEWTLPDFRNFCHQQQFLAWQHRHAQLYGTGGGGGTRDDGEDSNNNDDNQKNVTSTDAKEDIPDGDGTNGNNNEPLLSGSANS